MSALALQSSHGHTSVQNRSFSRDARTAGNDSVEVPRLATIANQLQTESIIGYLLVQLASVKSAIDFQSAIRFPMEAEEDTSTPLPVEVEQDFSSIAAKFVEKFQCSIETKARLRVVETSVNGIEAYEKLSEILSGTWSEYAVTCFLENPTNRYRHVLLGLFVDDSVPLSPDTYHCLAGLLHSSDGRVANCAALALQSGGDYASRLLAETIEKFPMENVQRFLDSYSAVVTNP